MFRELVARLTQPAPAPLPETDVPHALAALLVRVAKSDRVYLFEEIARIDRILSARFDLDPVAAAKLRAEAERLERALPETDRFAAVLCDCVPYAERLRLLEALWQVMMADGVAHADQRAAVDAIEAALGIADYDSAALREAARSIP